MKNWSIPIGRLFGVDVRVHWTFLIMLLFVGLTESLTEGRMGVPRALGLLGIVFASVALHELAHALVSSRLNVRVQSIMLLPLGGMTITEPSEETRPAEPAREVPIALAGPVTNFVVALIGAAVVLAVVPQAALLHRPWVWTGSLPRSIVWVNVFLGAFNLLPAFPMDGGRILRAVLARNTDFYSASRRAHTVSLIFATACFLVGAWVPWFIVIGLVLLSGAQMEERAIMFQSVLERVKLEDVMLTDFAVLSPADTLEDALAKAVHTLQDDFPVIRGRDMVGIISRQRIAAALRETGNAYVQSAMVRAYEVGNRSENLASAFRKIASHSLNLLPVVDGERLIGIVTLQNLMHSMTVMAESRRWRFLRRKDEQ